MNVATCEKFFMSHKKLAFDHLTQFLERECKGLSEEAKVKIVKHVQKDLTVFTKPKTKGNGQKIWSLLRYDLRQGLSLEQSFESKLRFFLFWSQVASMRASSLKTKEKESFMLWQENLASDFCLKLNAAFQKLKTLEQNTCNQRNNRFLDRSLEMMFALDKNGQFEYFNKQVRFFTGYTENQLKKMAFRDLIHPGDLQNFKDWYNVTKEQNTVAELRVVNKAGLTKKIVVDIIKNQKANKVLSLECIARDLSSDESLQSKLDDRYKKMQDAYIELGKVNRKISFLQEMAISFSQEKSLEESIDYMLYVLSITWGAETVVIRELLEESDKLKHISAIGFEDDWRKLKFLTNKKSIDWQAVEKRKKVFTSDITYDKDGAYQELVRKQDLKSVIAIPIFFKKDILGVISAWSSEVSKFDHYEDDLIDAIIGQLSLALLLRKRLQK